MNGGAVPFRPDPGQSPNRVDHEAPPGRLVGNALVKGDGGGVGFWHQPAQMGPVLLLAMPEHGFEQGARHALAACRGRHVEIVEQAAPASRDRFRQMEDDGKGHQLIEHEAAPAAHAGVGEQGAGKAVAVAAIHLAFRHLGGIGAQQLLETRAIVVGEKADMARHVGVHCSEMRDLRMWRRAAPVSRQAT